MKRIRIVGLCLVAVFAIGTVVSASASAAAPEYLVCGRVSPRESGKYDNKGCSEPSKGRKKEGDYELENWEHAKKLRFKARSGAFAWDVYIPGTGVVGELSCNESKAEGELTGPKTASEVLTLEKCQSSGKVFTGDLPGTKTGDIITYTLDETLFNTSQSGSGVAEEVKGTGPDDEWAAWDAEGLEGDWSGAESGAVTGDVGVVSTVSHIIFETADEGAPVIESSEPWLNTVVGTGTTPGGVTLNTEVKGEALEIS